MARRRPNTTNEWEFQGQVLTWLQEELKRRPGLGLDQATQEAPNDQSKRSDLVVWHNRAARRAFLALEIKTPTTPITDPILLRDACEKAWRWSSQYFAIWNMQTAELYRTPPPGRIVDPTECLNQWPTDPSIRSVDDWLDPSRQPGLQRRAVELLDKAWDHNAHSRISLLPLDASVFVDRLAHHQHELKALLLTQVKTMPKGAERSRLRALAAQDGFLGFVADYEEAIAGQHAYRLVGQVLFYFALRRQQPSLPLLDITADDDLTRTLRTCWDAVRRFDYEALFAPTELETLIPLSDSIEAELRSLIGEFRSYDWSSVGDDILGAVFERLIPREEQLILGQFYTPPSVADLLLSLCIRTTSPNILDPGCGSGTFLMRAYDYMRSQEHRSHGECLSRIWGFDISPFASELSVINLFRQDLASFDNYPRVLSGNFFDRAPGQYVDFPPSRIGASGKISIAIPHFEVIVGNPPYLRSQNQDDLDPEYKRALIALAESMGVTSASKLDLFAYFLLHAHAFAQPGTRIGFVISASWLTAGFGTALQRFLLKHYRLLGLLASTVEPFFSLADINTVLVVAERRADSLGPTPGERILFLRFTRELSTLFPTGPDYWDRLNLFADVVEYPDNASATPDYEIRLVDAHEEYRSLVDQPHDLRNWSRHLRSGQAFETLMAEASSRLCHLERLADVALGFKSLQNEFFYLSPATVASHGIEASYLRPICLFNELSRDRYSQDSLSPSTSLLFCDKSEHDLRGTAAFRYIRRMANVPANKKKQTQAATAKTIREVLELQGGRYWYGPKAAYRSSNIWLRKAFDGVYSPFLFSKGAVVDQRCNRIEPKQGIEWKELAAILTSSVFALVLESEGRAAMGAGALEWPTTQLRQARILNVLLLSPSQRADLVSLAAKVWDNEAPVDFGSKDAPGKHLRALDVFVLGALQSSVSVDSVHASIRDAVRSRGEKAKSRQSTARKTESDNVDLVVQNIVGTLLPLFQSRQFPESYLDGNEPKQRISIPSGIDVTVHADQFLTEAHVSVLASDKAPLWEATLGHTQAEVVVRALQLGRREFAIPDSEVVAARVLSEHARSFAELLKQLGQLVQESALGTSYESEVRVMCLRALGISPSAEAGEVWGMHLLESSHES